MKALTLYIDKWYIIAAVCNDGVPSLITPPNREDRFWLYFYEDISNNEVVYGKDNQSHFRNGEAHYIGDVFGKIDNPFCRFSRYEGKYEEIKGIFQASGIFDVLRNAVETEETIDTYISFSPDILGPARLVFFEELISNNFKVIGSEARIGFLTLEHNRRHDLLLEEGYYLVLNACNENLHYILYKKEKDEFISYSENVLHGMGVDLRGRALVETIVDSVNNRTHFLSSNDEKEFEYLRMGQFVQNWLVKIANAKPFVPITIPNVSFANQPANIFQVSIIKKKLDERTAIIVNNIIRVVTDFVRTSGVRNDEIKGLVFIGNTFTNDQFERAIREKFFVREDYIIRHKETDLPNIIGVYPLLEGINENDWRKKAEEDLDKRQKQAEFNEEKGKLDNYISTRSWNDARNQLASMLNLYLDFANELTKYKKIIEDGEKTDKQAEDKKYISAMEQVANHESKQEYEKMKEWCEIALLHKPDDFEAKRKLDDAIRFIAEQAATAKQYNQIIQRANNSFMNKQWNEALSQSEAALNVRPNSPEAIRIRDAARKQIGILETIKESINRVDIFIGQNLYSQALDELQKIKSLDSSYSGIKEREEKIKNEQDRIAAEVEKLAIDLEQALKSKKYEKAESICNELIDIDFANSKKWNRKLSEIGSEKKLFAAQIERWNQLLSNIKSAQWDEDYTKMISLCNQALEIDSQNQEIKELLANAQTKAQEQQVKVYIEKAQKAVTSGSYKKAISIIREALTNDSANETLKELLNKYSEKAESISSEVNVIAEEMHSKEKTFDYKSAIELCNQLIKIDAENKTKWHEEMQRIQSLQIEKSDLELNFRRKKADIKQLIRSGNIDAAKEQIRVMRQKYLSFGISTHESDFVELLNEIDPGANLKKQGGEPSVDFRKPTVSKKTQKEKVKSVKSRKPINAEETIRQEAKKTLKPKKVDTKSPAEPAKSQSEISVGKEGLTLLREKKYVQAKRYFALSKDNKMAEVCTNLIRLDKANKLGTISKSEMDLYKILCERYNIIL